MMYDNRDRIVGRVSEDHYQPQGIRPETEDVKESIRMTRYSRRPVQGPHEVGVIYPEELESPRGSLYDKHEKKSQDRQAKREAELKQLYTDKFRKAMYAETEEKLVNTVESMDVAWADSNLIKLLIETLDQWASHFLQHNDKSVRFKMMALRYTLIHRCILRKAKKARNEYVKGMPSWAFDTKEMLKRLEQFHEKKRQAEEAMHSEADVDLHRVLRSLQYRIGQLEILS